MIYSQYQERSTFFLILPSILFSLFLVYSFPPRFRCVAPYVMCHAAKSRCKKKKKDPFAVKTSASTDKARFYSLLKPGHTAKKKGAKVQNWKILTYTQQYWERIFFSPLYQLETTSNRKFLDESSSIETPHSTPAANVIFFALCSSHKQRPGQTGILSWTCKECGL